MYRNPKLISLNKIGNNSIGFLSVVENNKEIPFEIKRVYWTFEVPENTKRGMHAHKELEQVIFALRGTIRFKIENLNNETFDFTLNQPNIGLYIPNKCWRDIYFSNDAILVSFASMSYIEDDYIRDYNQFKSNNWK